MRFDTDSFKEEITNKDEARACYHYFTQNMQEFLNELYATNTPQSELQVLIGTVWRNLLASCDRVGYTNQHLEAVRDVLVTKGY